MIKVIKEYICTKSTKSTYVDEINNAEECTDIPGSTRLEL